MTKIMEVFGCHCGRGQIDQEHLSEEPSVGQLVVEIRRPCQLVIRNISNVKHD